MRKLSEFTQTQPAKSGKNKSSSNNNGIWTDTSRGNQQSYYIKFPSDQRELFTEYFAGKFIHTLIKHRIIPQADVDCFCTTELIKDDQGTLGLLQPFKSGTKALHQVIGTSQLCHSDRSSWLESLYGKHYYSKIHPTYHASMIPILTISTLIADHSVHSGNVLVDASQAYRIDFGAAWRHILDPDNSDPWMPSAYKCCLPKFFYQDYLQNYPVNILNQLPAYAEQMRIAMAHGQLTWNNIIRQTLNDIPRAYHQQITAELPVDQLADALYVRTANLCGDEERPTIASRPSMTPRASHAPNRESTIRESTIRDSSMRDSSMRDSSMRDSSMSRPRSSGHSDLSRHSLFRAIESVDDNVKNSTGSKWTFNAAKPFIVLLSGVAYGIMYPFKMLCSALFEMRNATSSSMGAVPT